MKKYFIAGVGTDIGKTITSAVLVEVLSAGYWKPLQCGNLHYTDSDIIKSLISNHYSVIYPETFRFKSASSPHHASLLENVIININHFKLPKTKNHLIIEGAGGVLTPINDKNFIIDIAAHFDCEVILVSHNYLGSINHTLLSIEAIKKRNIKIKGIIFNGQSIVSTENFIIKNSGILLLGRIPQLPMVNKQTIQELSKNFCDLAK